MKQNRTILAFFIALAIAAIWTYFNRQEYVYEGNNIFLFNTINVFPLVLWTLALTALFALYEHMRVKYKLLAITLIYFMLLSAIEWFGYHVLNIRLASNEPSLFNLGIIHATPHMKIFYIAAGPLYIILVSWIQKLIPYPTYE